MEADPALALCDCARILVCICAAGTVWLAGELRTEPTWAENVHHALRGRRRNTGADTAEADVVPSVFVAVTAGKVVGCQRIAADALEAGASHVALGQRAAGDSGAKINSCADAISADIARCCGVLVIAGRAICCVGIGALTEDTGASDMALVRGSAHDAEASVDAAA